MKPDLTIKMSRAKISENSERILISNLAKNSVQSLNRSQTLKKSKFLRSSPEKSEKNRNSISQECQLYGFYY